MCAQAMSWGMEYQQFWHCTWSEMFSYLRLMEIRAENRVQELDYESWMQGKRFCEALVSVYPLFNGFIDGKKSKKYPYPEKPYYMLEQERIAKETKAESLKFKAKQIEKHNMAIQRMLKEKRATSASSD